MKSESNFYNIKQTILSMRKKTSSGGKGKGKGIGKGKGKQIREIASNDQQKVSTAPEQISRNTVSQELPSYNIAKKTAHAPQVVPPSIAAKKPVKRFKPG